MVVCGSAAIARAALPSSLVAPEDLFETTGALHLEANYAGASLVGTFVVEVEDCGTFTYTTATAGTVRRVAPNNVWAVDLDLSACQAYAAIVRTHHCDGYGSTFETCELEGDAAADRAITATFTLANRQGVQLCRSDLDGDGDAECDLVEGTLVGEAGLEEVYVPARYWSQAGDGTWVCESRTSGQGARKPWNQGGYSCELLGL